MSPFDVGSPAVVPVQPVLALHEQVGRRQRAVPALVGRRAGAMPERLGEYNLRGNQVLLACGVFGIFDPF